ncbi:MAG: hypothetical protein IAF94_09430 [Pirellulaceae bacterium]|nr:hypothetical protein [Pirellulaceae bacterium]
MIPTLNPVNRIDQQTALAGARLTHPTLITEYKSLLREHGLLNVLVVLTAGDNYQTAEAAEQFLILATVLGAMAEMTADN